MNWKIIKNESEILELDEKILNGYLFVLIISTNKNEAIFRSFGNEHYLDYFKKLE
jgi:hypothetical protein